MHTIDGSLIVINPDKDGASIVVPEAAGRSRFVCLRARRDAVHLIDENGEAHLLDETRPHDAESAAIMGTLLVREIDINAEHSAQETVNEYVITSDIDLSLDAESGSRLTP